MGAGPQAGDEDGDDLLHPRGQVRDTTGAGLAVSAAERLFAPADLPVVLAGGLFAHGGLEAAVRKRIEKARSGS